MCIQRYTHIQVEYMVYLYIKYDLKTRLAPTHTAKLQYSTHETEWKGDRGRGHAGPSILGHASAP